MAHSKRRVYQHIMEDKSMSLLRSRLPEEWVIREYRPDYGIDLAIEVFKFVDYERTKADSLGEWFFSQVKSISKTKISKVKVSSVYNEDYDGNKINSDEFIKIDAIPFRIDTDELLTIQAMGSAIPVILFLVTLDTQKVFFLCLNDLIDKVIITEDPNYTRKSTKTIYIPIKNEVTLNNEATLQPLRFYAKRPKLFSAFSKFIYQEDKVRYLVDDISTRIIEEFPQCSILNVIQRFLRIIKPYDFWETTAEWGLILHCYKHITSLESLINKILRTGKVELSDFNQAKPIEGFCPVESACFLLKSEIRFTWQCLKSLSNLYEEECREWYLPTFYAHSPDAKN